MSKPKRSAANRVQGIDSSVEDLVIRATGRQLALEVGPGIIPIPKLTRTINGASSVELEVEDPERRLLRHSLVSSKWDIELDGLHFRYPGGLSKKGDLLTLTLEDRWIALLREKKGPKRVVRGSGKGQMTRAEFIKMLVEEACGKGLDFYCPQLHVQQPIKKPSQAKKAKEEAKEKRRKGIGDVKGLKVKGQAASKPQIELGDMALRIAESVKAPDVVQVALIAALIDENDMSGPNCLQAEPFTAEGASTPAAKEISGFLTGKPKWTGTTAIGYYKAHPTAKFYEIAQAVQGSGAGEGSNGQVNYGQFGKEAEEWVEAFGGGELSESINVTEPYEFKVAKKEDYWSAIKELAKEVNWRAFIVGDRFFFVPEPELLQGMVRLAIDDNTPGIESIDFDYDGNNPVTEVEVEALVSQWKPPPGSVVTLSDYGPASVGFGDAPVKKDKKGQKAGLSGNRNANTKEGTARLILSSIEVPLSDEPAQRMAIIKLHRPTPPLPEPAAETKSLSGINSNAIGNKTVERMLVAMERAAEKNKPYVWGGEDPNTGVDCSGAVSFALRVGGFMEGRTDTKGLASFGEAGPGEFITIYDHANTGNPQTEHTAIEIAGVVFESGGGSENNNPNGGLGKVTSGVTDFLKQFEIKRHPKGY
jgi:hypothetical protein